MILKRFYDDGLAQASYLIGCAATGEALIVDPNRDVRHYIDAARAERLRIMHVTETHIHADFVSGLKELVARTGARAYLSAAGGPDWSYRFAEEIRAVPLADNAEFSVGNIRIRALHTPGHTPEHLSFLITDTAGANEPMGVLTGDFVFAGDVGRPDLLERAAGAAGTMEAGARQLFASLQRIRTLPEWVQLWPGHGAGSACGKSLGAVPSTTLGYELRFNWAFSMASEDEFVEAVLAGQPEPPKYFAEMKRINREGPPVQDGPARPPQLQDDALAAVLRGDAIVIDTRRWSKYRDGFVAGTLNIPLNRSFTTWAGWLIPYDRDIYMIIDGDAASAESAVRDLSMIGLDRVAGYFTVSALQHHMASGGTLSTLPELTPAQVSARYAEGAVAILDVRGAEEWRSGHIPGVPNIPLGYLPDRIAEVPRDRPVVVHCESGSRSAIAASVLVAHGIRDVANLAGGISRWAGEGNPVEAAEVVGAG